MSPLNRTRPDIPIQIPDQADGRAKDWQDDRKEGLDQTVPQLAPSGQPFAQLAPSPTGPAEMSFIASRQNTSSILQFIYDPFEGRSRHHRPMGETMRLIHAPLAAALLLAGCAGGRPFTATTYGPAALLGGYSEKQIEPGVWKVTGRSNGIAEMGFGRNMAVYRAAELMKAAGFAHFQIIDQKGKSTMIGYGTPNKFAGEELTVTVRGAASPDEPLACRAKQPSACGTLGSDEVMARLGPQLTFRGSKNASAN